MSKRLIILILCLSLVIGSSVPVFAVSTDSAIKLKSVGSLSDVRANGETVAPVSSSTTRWFLNSNGAVGSVSTTISTWGQLVYDITYSIAYSADQLDNRLSGLLNYVSAFTNKFSTTWPSDILTSVGRIQQYITTLDSSVSNIETILTSSGAISVDIGDSFKYPWGYYNYYKTNKTVTLGRVNENGNYYTQGVYTNNLDYFGMIQYWIVEHVKNMALGVTTITGNVKNGANSDVLTYTDLSTVVLEHDSMWDDLDHIGANLSAHLARLAFVLASDEEIAARQAAADNTDQVVDDFINSSGSASASTSDFADVASAGSAMKDALSSNVSPTNAFTSFSSSSSAWDWFSQDTADSLDSTTRSNSRRGSTTPYLDSYYNDLLETLTLR